MFDETESTTTDAGEKVPPNPLQSSELRENPVKNSGSSSKFQLREDGIPQGYYRRPKIIRVLREKDHRINNGYKPHRKNIWHRDPILAKGGLNHMRSSDYQHIIYDPNLPYNLYTDFNVAYGSRMYNNPVNIGHSNYASTSRSHKQKPVFNNPKTIVEQKNDRNYIREPNSFWKDDDNLRPAYNNEANQFHNETTSRWEHYYHNFPSHPHYPPPPHWYGPPMEPTNAPGKTFNTPLFEAKKTKSHYNLPHFNIYDDPPSNESNKQPNFFQLPKHEFTGWAGYYWPTVKKVTPKKSDPEEESMRVYTKPSFSHKRTYSSDFIKNALKKYTHRLKLLIFKHFPKDFQIKAGHLETADIERKENIQPGHT